MTERSKHKAVRPFYRLPVNTGFRIPTLCYHKDLSPTGNCRMCVVEVKGGRFLQAACVTPVWEGMEIQTHSEKVIRDRKLTLELMLANHPQDCITCDVSGECELQDLAYEYQVAVPEWGTKGTRYPVDSDPNPFIRVDMNKCILCRRCVLACAEIQVRYVWGVAERGFEEQIVAGADTTMLEARCESCGQCVAYCPTGALSNKMNYGHGACPPGQESHHHLHLLRRRLPVRPDGQRQQGHRRHVQPECAGQWHGAVRQGPLWLRLRPPPRPADEAAGATLSAGRRKEDRSQMAHAWEWVETDWDTALDITAEKLTDDPRHSRRGQHRRAHLGKVPERRKLSDEQTGAAGHRDEQHRPLRPSLTLQHRGRSGHFLWFGRNVQLDGRCRQPGQSRSSSSVRTPPNSIRSSAR